MGVVEVGLLILCATIAAQADDLPAANEARTFETASSVSYTIHASAFTPDPGFGGTAGIQSGGDRFCEGTTTCRFTAPVLLPAGARVARIDLEACDSSSTTSMTAALFRAHTFPGGEDSRQVASIDFTADACIRMWRILDGTGHTIDNHREAYFARVFSDGEQNVSSATRFMAVRVYYYLQVSPAPAVATFGDVPVGHPQRQ
jgi:hypothetical protein